MLGMVILKLALAACVDGSVAACTLPSCASAHKECVGVIWEPCTCDVPAGCVEGSATACTLAGCAAAQSVCTGGVVGACQCAIQTCDDGNLCTTDALAGAAGSYTCTHTPRTGVACSDGDICNGAETCTAGGACLPGTPPDLNDSNACTYDYCDATGIHHDTVASCAPATDGAEAGASPGVAPNPLAQPVPQMAGLPGLDVVENTGEVRYRYEFPLPAARGRYQPGLRLTYSSTSVQNEGYGHGWSLSTSFVEQSSQGGPYQLNLNGGSAALVNMGDGTYRPEIGAALVSLTPTPGGAGWVGVDTAGNTYTFDTYFGWGYVSGGRWYLRTVVDVDGNKTVFTYQRESGPAALITDVSYNNYLSGGVETFAHSASLTYAERSRDEVGNSTALMRWNAELAGGSCEFAHVLTTVSVRVQASGFTNLRSYAVGYTHPWAVKPGMPAQILLTSITPKDSAGLKALPATTFTYGHPQLQTGYALSSTPQSFSAPMSPAIQPVEARAGAVASSWWMDLDGDGLPDRVGNAPGGGLQWARNTTVTGGSTITFAPVAPLPGTSPTTGVPGFAAIANTLLQAPAPRSGDVGTYARHTAAVDMNGDGLPDLVQDATAFGATSCAGLLVRMAQKPAGQLGYAAPVCFPGPTWVGRFGDVNEQLADVNSDGAADYTSPGGAGWLSTGSGFVVGQATHAVASIIPSLAPVVVSAAQVFTNAQCVTSTVDMSLHPEAFCTFYGDPREVSTVADLNGDALLDRVTRKSDGTWAMLWGTGPGTFATAPLGIPTGFPNPLFPGSIPDKASISCDCNYNDYPYGWKEVSGTVSANFWGWDAGFVDLTGDGVADYVTNASGLWTAYVGQLSPTLLRTVTTGAGATAYIGYSHRAAFGAGPRQGVLWMATSLSISGPRMPSAKSYYWYAEPRGGQTWYLPIRYEPRGFARTWVYDGATELVRETTWATGSHVFAGSPTRVSWATASDPITSYDPAQPPTGYSEFRRLELSLGTTPVGSGMPCTDSASEPPSYPVFPVTTLAKTTAWVGTTAFSSQRTVSCTEVDVHGNTLHTTVDPDTSVTGDELHEYVAYDPAATCKSCPTWTKTVNRAQWDASDFLAQTFFLYDSPIGTWSSPLPQGQAGKGRLAFVRKYSSATASEVASATIYNANGTVASLIMDPYAGAHARSWTETYTYDAQGLRITKTRVSDAGVVLAKDAGYDSLGHLVLEQGPYVEGTTQAKPTRAYAYDGFGRVLAVGRSVSGNQMLGTIAAAEYVDASPPAVRSYTFLAPQTITIGAVPTRPDVKQVVTHADNLGRTVEVRERLGVAGTLDATAKITQVLSGYRVAQSVKYDAAGRVVAALEPQLRPNTPSLSTEAYEGFEILAPAANVRGSMTLFDAQGRISCSMAGVYAAVAATAAAVAATGAACTSSLDENGSFRVATPYAYGTATVNGRPMATALAAPPAKSAVRPTGTTAYYRADGLLDFTSDHYGNTSKFAYDLLGRSTSLTRMAAGKLATAQATTRTYDLLGRVTQEWDPNWSPGAGANSNPSRLYEYDAIGRVQRVRLPFDPTAMARAELRFEYRSLGRKTKAYALEPSLVAGGLTFTSRTLADLAYDTAYQGSASYGYVAGRLASMASPLTTIAMGYDQNGRTTRRDQWFTGLTGAFSATGSFADDGRLLSAGFASGYATAAAWTGSYDSAGRPVKVGLTAPAALAAALWEAPLAGTASPYDALDRIGVVKSNNGLVTTSRTYATWSGQLTAHGVATSATQVYGVSEIVYLATKLKHVRDTGTGTVYDYAYDANGRLSDMGAGYGSGALAQSYSQSTSFSDAAWPAGATVGNLERVTNWQAGGAVVSYDYAQDRLVSTSSATGATVNKYLHDHAGRLTSKRTAAGAETEGFAYDIQDQLRQVKRSGVVTEKLEYDPTGAPLFRMVGNQAIYYVGPFATVTATADPACTGYGCPAGTGAGKLGNVQVAAHVILAGGRIASVRAANVLYYHRDRQGSVVATTVTNGQVGVKYRYTPYGQLDKAEGADAANGSELGYTGGLRLGWNPATGARQGDLVLLGARVYDAALKRWLQADTVDAQRYTYTDGDPVNMVDPSGRMPISDGYSFYAFQPFDEWTGIPSAPGIHPAFLVDAWWLARVFGNSNREAVGNPMLVDDASRYLGGTEALAAFVNSLPTVETSTFHPSLRILASLSLGGFADQLTLQSSELGPSMFESAQFSGMIPLAAGGAILKWLGDAIDHFSAGKKVDEFFLKQIPSKVLAFMGTTGSEIAGGICAANFCGKSPPVTPDGYDAFFYCYRIWEWGIPNSGYYKDWRYAQLFIQPGVKNPPLGTTLYWQPCADACVRIARDTNKGVQP